MGTESDKPENNEDDGLQQRENKLHSERYDDLREALELLYIKNNPSGRIVFMKAWPELTTYIFGEDLIKMDTEGTQDRDVKAILEEEAEERRFAFLEIVETLETRSVVEGVLQKEYVQETIEKLGDEIATLLYSPEIIERVTGKKPVVKKDVDDQEEGQVPDKEGVATPEPVQTGQPAPEPQTQETPETPPVPAESAKETENNPDEEENPDGLDEYGDFETKTI